MPPPPPDKTDVREPDIYSPADTSNGSAHDQVHRPQGGRIRDALGAASQGCRLHPGATRLRARHLPSRIAYYEAESDHPPVGFLGDLARVLNTTTDELLGHGAGKTKTRPVTLSPRLERRLKQIERLSPKPKQQLLFIIDTFIAAEEHRSQGSRS